MAALCLSEGLTPERSVCDQVVELGLLFEVVSHGLETTRNIIGAPSENLIQAIARVELKDASLIEPRESHAVSNDGLAVT